MIFLTAGVSFIFSSAFLVVLIVLFTVISDFFSTCPTSLLIRASLVPEHLCPCVLHILISSVLLNFDNSDIFKSFLLAVDTGVSFTLFTFSVVLVSALFHKSSISFLSKLYLDTIALIKV